MKTTVELPDELLMEAKKRAIELRRPLRALIEEGLRSHLERLRQADYARGQPIRWVTSEGGLPPGLDPSDREAMADWATRERSGT